MDVLLIILIILAIILLVPFGLRLLYDKENLSVFVRLFVFNISVYPKKEKDKEKPKEKKPKKEKKSKKAKKEKAKPSFDEIIEYIKIGLHALGRFRRKLVVNVLNLKILIATDDPYNTAMLYGNANAVSSAILPLLDQSLNIKKREILFGVSFEKEKIEAECELVMTLNLLKVLGIVLFAGIEFLKFRKRLKKQNEDKINDINETKERELKNGCSK